MVKMKWHSDLDTATVSDMAVYSFRCTALGLCVARLDQTLVVMALAKYHPRNDL